MARKLVVEVVGDFDSLNRGFQRSSRQAQKFGNDISKIGRGTLAASLSFRGLGRSVAFASSTFLGGVGLGLAVKSVVDEMTKQQRVAAQTAAAIKSTGDVSGVTAKHVQDLASQLLNLTGIDDEVIKSGENMLLTFTNIRNVAGKNNDVFDQATKVGLDMATALEGAGFEGGNLQTTMIRLGKALNDPVRGITALRRVGVQFTEDQTKLIKRLVETGHTLDAQKLILRELRREFGGSAEAAGSTLTGKLGVLRETVKNVSASLLEEFLPAITRIVDRLVAWVKNTENQKRVLNDARQVISAVTDVLKALHTAFNDLNKISGSTRRTLELLLGTFVAFKAIKLVGGVAGLASAFSGATAGATTFSAALAGNAGLIALTGAAAFALTTMGLRATGLDKKLRQAGGSVFDFAAKIGLVTDQTKQFEGKIIPKAGDIERFRSAIKKLMDTRNITKENAIDVFVQLHPRVNKHDVEVAAGVLGSVLPPAGALGPISAEDVKAKRPGKVVDPGPTKKELAAIQARLKASREAARQAVQDQAELAVDRATLTKSVNDDIAALEKLNALLKRRIAGGHSTIELQRQQIDTEKQLADLFEQQAEARKKARTAAQFKRLGFGPTGEDLVPGVKNLKNQLRSVTDAIEGSFLDTKKTGSLLRHIRQVLSGGLGSVSSEVRAKIQSILADLKAQLKKSSVDVTRFQKSATGQFTLAGASPGAHALTINGGIHLHGVQNVQQLENALAKRKKQRAHARRGTR